MQQSTYGDYGRNRYQDGVRAHGRDERASGNRMLIQSNNPGYYLTKRSNACQEDFHARHFSSEDDDLDISHHRSKMKSLSSLRDLRASTSHHMSEKIDRFLEVVEQCEMELQQEYEDRRRRVEESRRRRSTQQPWYSRSVSNMTSPSEGVSRKTSELSVKSNSAGFANPRQHFAIQRSAESASKPKIFANGKNASTAKLIRSKLSAASTRGISSSNDRVPSAPLKAFKKIPEYPMPDTNSIQSKLKQDRNYQPPRRRKLVKKSIKKSKAKQEYEDDFEDEGEEGDNGVEADDDDEEEEEGEMFLAKQWIHDQAIRGLVRQRAMLLNSRQESHDKESSKDSAYGYSGGESRLATTREPTPDTFLQQNRFRRIHKGNYQDSSKHIMRKQFGSTTRLTSRDLHLDSEDERSSAYVGFVNKVTGEILKRGVYTDRALKEVLDSQSKEHKGISSKEVATLLYRMRKELGIQSANSLNASMSEANLKDLLYEHGSTRRNVARQVQMKSAQLRNRDNQCDNVHGDISDQELSQILYEMNLDNNTVGDTLRTLRQREVRVKNGTRDPITMEEEGDTGDQLKLFDSLNISNLNISFNASSQVGKERHRNDERALLVKSFAHHSATTERRRPTTSVVRQDSSSSSPDVPARPISAKCVVVEEEPKRSQMPDTPLHSSETPRSSSLYQPESDEEKLDSEISEDLKDQKEDGDEDEIVEECSDEVISD